MFFRRKLRPQRVFNSLETAAYAIMNTRAALDPSRQAANWFTMNGRFEAVQTAMQQNREFTINTALDSLEAAMAVRSAYDPSTSWLWFQCNGETQGWEAIVDAFNQRSTRPIQRLARL